MSDATMDADVGVVARLAQMKPEVRSPLRRWMARHADELMPCLTMFGRPNWQAMAAEIRRR